MFGAAVRELLGLRALCKVIYMNWGCDRSLLNTGSLVLQGILVTM